MPCGPRSSLQIISKLVGWSGGVRGCIGWKLGVLVNGFADESDGCFGHGAAWSFAMVGCLKE